MNRLAIGALAILAATGPALAQPGAAPARPAATSPPATVPAATPPPTIATPPGPANLTTPPEVVTIEPPPVTNQPAPQAPPPPAEVDIPLSGDYPNGFQDPADPFANSVRADNDRDSGFPWGLLGLLGLLGLIPLVRGYGHRNVTAERERERIVTRRDGE